MFTVFQVLIVNVIYIRSEINEESYEWLLFYAKVFEVLLTFKTSEIILRFFLNY